MKCHTISMSLTLCSIFPQARCEPTDPTSLCDTDSGSRRNYGFMSNSEPLGGDGGRGCAAEAPWIPAYVHLWWGPGSGQSGQGCRQVPHPEVRGTGQASRMRSTASSWQSSSHCCFTTANQDPDVDSKRQRQPIRCWERASGGSCGGGCEGGVLLTVRWTTGQLYFSNCGSCNVPWTHQYVLIFHQWTEHQDLCCSAEMSTNTASFCGGIAALLTITGVFVHVWQKQHHKITTKFAVNILQVRQSQ